MSLILRRHRDILARWPDDAITVDDIEREFKAVPVEEHIRRALQELVTFIATVHEPFDKSEPAAVVKVAGHEFIIGYELN